MDSRFGPRYFVGANSPLLSRVNCVRVDAYVRREYASLLREAFPCNSFSLSTIFPIPFSQP